MLSHNTTIEEVFGRQPGIMAKQVVRVLNKQLLGSIAPLLLSSTIGMRRIDGIGKTRAIFIQEALQDAQLRLRYEEERVHIRAKDLYGSVDDTPVQALLVISTLSGAFTFGFFAPSPAVELIARLTPNLTIGALSLYTESVESLSCYFEVAGCSIDERHVRDTHYELTSRLSPWRSALTSAHA